MPLSLINFAAGLGDMTYVSPVKALQILEIIRTVARLNELSAQARANGQTIGLVPTMGALHDGHLSLVERARRENDIVIVSVFVNPTQFNNQADLATYPRTEEADCALLGKAGVDYAFIPTIDEVYPEPDTRVFDLGPVAEVMEGPMRPGHFNGVAQIVSKLFNWSHPDRAYFGEKDFQQIAVIRRMAEIAGFDSIDIVACPICRAADGLALSSRNVRLTPEQRAEAPGIYRVLTESVDMMKDGADVETVRNYVVDTINRLPFMTVEYYSIVDGHTMQPIAAWSDTDYAAGCITVYCGDVRLIDNITYKRPEGV